MTASMTLTFALLLASGVADTGPRDAFFYTARTGALSFLMVYVLVSVSALRLYLSAVINGDSRPRYCPSAERSRRSTCSFAIWFRLRPFPTASFPTSSGADSYSGSRSRPPCHSYAGESAKASRVTEFADRMPPDRSPG